MTWAPPDEAEVADGAAVAMLATLQAILIVARRALLVSPGERYRARVGDLLLVPLEVLDAAIEQYRVAATSERLRRDDELF